MVELRCSRHMHARVIERATLIEIKCSQCSKALQRDVCHYWAISEDGTVRMLGDCPHDTEARAS